MELRAGPTFLNQKSLANLCGTGFQKLRKKLKEEFKKMNGIYLTMFNVILTLVILFLNSYYGFYMAALICCLGFLIVLGIGLIALWAGREEEKKDEK